MLGVLIFLTVVAAPAAGSMLSLQVLHNSVIKGNRLSFSNTLLRQNFELAQVATGEALIQPENLLRLRGGKKGTASQGKRGTGHKAHPSYKYNLRQVNTICQDLISLIANLALAPQLSPQEQSWWNHLEALYPQEKPTGFFQVYGIMFHSDHACYMFPQGKGRMRHMRKVCQRFKNGFRCSPPYQGPAVSTSANSATPA